MKGIIFAGCSFTWGQGLYFYSDLPDLYYPKNFECEISKIKESHMKFMQTKRFSRLVANHFNTFDVVKFCNGGCDDDSLLFLDLLFKKNKTQDDWYQITTETYDYDDIDYVVVQLTHPHRSMFYFELDGIQRRVFIFGDGRHDVDGPEYLQEWLKRNNLSFEEFYPLHKKQLIERVKEKLIFLENKGIKPIILTWINDHLPYILEDEWLSNHFMKLKYNNQIYDSITDLINENGHLEIYQDKDTFENPPLDKHPSLLCHRIIADNIIEKINQLEKN